MLFQSPCDLNYVQLTSVQRRQNNIFVCWHKQNAVVEKKMLILFSCANYCGRLNRSGMDFLYKPNSDV